ncbi:MAG: hypothetical protein HEP71_12500 [Roseivirga sp.]|nr:hypothetical protein [Roseivirga sp.]
MKYLFFLLSLLLLLSCEFTDTEIKRDPGDIAWSDKNWIFEVTDTVHVSFVDKLIRLYDTSPDRSKHLLMSSFNSFEVVVIDDSGKILARHKPIGQGDEFVGAVIFGLGFVGDDKFVASSPKGFYVYELLTGEFIRSYPLRTPLRGYETSESYNIEQFIRENEVHFAGGLQSSLEDKDIMNFKKEYFDEFKPITFMNTANNSASLNFGIGPTSRFRRHDYHYGELYTLFDFDPDQEFFAVLTNPSDEISIWDTNSRLIKEIPLRLNRFKLPVKYKYGKGGIEDATQAVNSMYRTLSLQGSNALLTYRTGVPEEDFRALSSYAELPALFRHKMKYFGAIVDIEKGEVSSEFELPEYAVGVASFISKDNMLLYTNSGVTETDSTTVFYRARLKEIE